MHEQINNGGYDTMFDWYGDDTFIARLFKERTGLDPAGPAALAIERERFLKRLVSSQKIGRVENLIQNFDRVHDEWIAPAPLQVGRVTDGELLLGDSPAVTFDSDTNAVGIAGGAALRTSDILVMPLTPTLVLAVGGDEGFVDLDAPAVERLNSLQLLAAVQCVFARPATDVTAFVDLQRRARQHSGR